MEPTNLHQLQDQPSPNVEACSTSTPSSYGVGSSHSWTPNTTLDAANFKPNLNNSMIQDLGYHQWRIDAESSLTNKDMSERLLLKTPLQGDLYFTNAQSYPSFGGKGVASRGNFSQIYPSINVPNFNQPSPSPAISSMQYLNQLTSTTTSYSGNWSQCTSQDHGLGEFTENLFFGPDQMHHFTDRTSSCNNSSNPSHFTNGMVETKRPSTLMESSKASQSQIASKKSRPESRSSCQPLKVRKEKLGDRVAALQQLVAPFGKTDTASVLMEAIGYIKFLQSQVETLSVPYMKSSRNQTNRVRQGGSATDNKNWEPKQDLRSRGLCLVPSSCMTYLAGDGGSGAWQLPNFGGTT